MLTFHPFSFRDTDGFTISIFSVCAGDEPGKSRTDSLADKRAGFSWHPHAYHVPLSHLGDLHCQDSGNCEASPVQESHHIQGNCSWFLFLYSNFYDIDINMVLQFVATKN